MIDFRKMLIKSESPKGLRQRLRLTTPPKCVKRNDQQTISSYDESLELFDGEGELLQNGDEDRENSD